MHRDLHRYLDGELPREALPPELAAEAAEWEALLGSAAQRSDARAPADLESRIMTALPARAKAQRAAWRRAVDWLLLPQSIQLRPVGVLAGAAAVVLLVLMPWSRASQPAATGNAGLAAADKSPIVYVQFVFAADQASSVSVAGDFNNWEPTGSVLRDADGDGVWTGLVAVRPGVHKYMFVVNGERWVTDPRAERYVDDGFGMRNALIAVLPPERERAST